MIDKEQDLENLLKQYNQEHIIKLLNKIDDRKRREKQDMNRIL